MASEPVPASASPQKEKKQRNEEDSGDGDDKSKKAKKEPPEYNPRFIGYSFIAIWALINFVSISNVGDGYKFVQCLQVSVNKLMNFV